MGKGQSDPGAALRALGQAITTARQRQGVTREGLSRASGLDVQLLDALESGREQPALSHLFKICLALEEHPESLFDTAREHHAVARLVTHADLLFGLYKTIRRDKAS